MDQSGMKKQLSQLHTLLSAVQPELSTFLDEHESGNMFFCFRWLLVWFKREFQHEEIMELWEVSRFEGLWALECDFEFLGILGEIAFLQLSWFIM